MNFPSVYVLSNGTLYALYIKKIVYILAEKNILAWKKYLKNELSKNHYLPWVLPLKQPIEKQT